MKKYKYKYAVVIGRFQLPHNGHAALFKAASNLAEHTIAVLGSANQPRTPKNPFLEIEREQMLKIMGAKIDYFVHVDDYHYSNQKWTDEVFTKVTNITFRENTILVGHEKDGDMTHKEMFDWHYKEVANVDNISSTKLRKSWYRGHNLGFISDEIRNYLIDWKYLYPDLFKYLTDEYNFNENYDASKYPRIEHTADAVVIQNGHVLLVTRGGMPGKGQLALPGGFVNVNETILETAYRELKEETNIDVPRKTLEFAVRDKQGAVFDHPNRDPRGRIITTAFLFELPEHKLTKIKSGDDASDAGWFMLSQIENLRSIIFSDHAEIIFKMTGNL